MNQQSATMRKFHVGQKVRIRAGSPSARYFPGDEPVIVVRVSGVSDTSCVAKTGFAAKWVKNDELEAANDRQDRAA
jgi:hypothetical protein